MEYIVRIGRPGWEAYRYVETLSFIGDNKGKAAVFHTYAEALAESKLHISGHVWPALPEDEYKIVNDTAYDWRTPDGLVALLEKMRMLRQRCAFVYGDVETGKPWEEVILDRGRIGRSTGAYKLPLLIKTRRSMGGGALLTHCILQVRQSAGLKKELWRHPAYDAYMKAKA